jgi:hypothetical protein
VKRLRDKGIPIESLSLSDRKRRTTATLLAEKLTRRTGEKYTRFVIADIEGRRERNVRWPELVALCTIFRVPLWELVLPPEDVGLDVKGIPLRPAPSGDWEVDDQGVIVLEAQPPNRDDLAHLLFNLPAATLLSDPELSTFRSEFEDAREKQMRQVMFKAAEEAMQQFRQNALEALGIDEKEND